MTTDRSPARPSRQTAVGARVLALGASAAATLSLMAGMAAAAPDDPSSTSTSTVDQGGAVQGPSFGPTDAPPTTSSHGS